MRNYWSTLENMKNMERRYAESALFTISYLTFFSEKIRQKGKFSVTSCRVGRDKYNLWIWWVEWVARVEWVEWVVWVVWRMFMLSLFGFAPFPLPGPTLYPTVGPISPSTPFFASSDSSKSLNIIYHKLHIIFHVLNIIYPPTHSSPHI